MRQTTDPRCLGGGKQLHVICVQKGRSSPVPFLSIKKERGQTVEKLPNLAKVISDIMNM